MGFDKKSNQFRRQDVEELGDFMTPREAYLLKRLTDYWSKLTIDDKKKVECFGNSIRFKKILPEIGNARSRFDSIKRFCASCDDELKQLGVLDNQYVLTKDREALRDKNFIRGRKKNTERWEFLSNLMLECADDLISIEHNTEPYIQLKHLFSAQMSTVPTGSGKRNYQNAFKHFSNYFEIENIPFDAKLKDILNEYLLLKFRRNYIIDKLESGALSPSSANTIMSAVRNVLKRATEIKGINFPSFIDIEGIDVKGRGVAKQYKPYAPSERRMINEAIQLDIAKIKALMEPYVRTGYGEYPINEKGNITPGKSTIDNARFLFENYLDCKPIFFHQVLCDVGQKFLNIVQSLDIGLHDIYRSWGILPIVDREVMSPFVLRLAQITGMNLDSIVELDMDALDMDHYATGKPCLRYWKERSTGAKEYYLDLFQADLQWLTKAQSKEIADVIETVKKLTSEIRESASDDIKDKLFIFESSGQTNYREIRKLDSLNQEYRKFADKHNLTDDNGIRTELTTSRFRPSFVSDLIDKGVSIREVQLMLGHSSIQTTMGYLDRLDFNNVARNKVKEALQNIHSKIVAAQKNTHKKDTYLTNPNNVIFTTPLGGCTNIFNPPDFIKKSSSYVKGQPCSQYNKCLSCPNVMLTESHLPELFAMRRDYLLLLQTNRIMDTPYGIVIQESLMILEDILSPKKSDFPAEALERGERLSLFVETSGIDGVTA